MLVLFLLFALGQFGRVSFLNQAINFYLYEIFSLVLLSSWILKYKLIPFRKIPKKYRSFLAFPLILIITYLINIFSFDARSNLIGGLYLGRLIFYLLFLIYLLHYIKQEKKEKNLTKGIFIFSLITIVVSVLQYFLYPNLRNLFYLGWDPHQFRLFGQFLDTAVAAGIFGLLILFYFLNNKNNYLAYIYGVLALLTYSRAMYISILFTSIAYFIANKLYKPLITLILIFAVALLILPKTMSEGTNLLRLSSIEGRLEDYKQGLEIYKGNPLFGIGYNRVGAVKTNVSLIDVSHDRASFHSSFLIILVTSGVLGLIAFIYFLFELGKFSFNTRYYLIFLSIFSLFDNILLHPFILFFLFGILALESKKI